MKLVVFYSLSSSTKKAAEKLVSKLGADMLRIDTVYDFPKSRAAQLFIGGFMSTFSIRPKLKKNKIDPRKYDTVIICTPVWAGKCAAPVDSLLEKYDLSNKKLYFLTTSGSADDKSCIKYMSKKSAVPIAVCTLKNPSESAETDEKEISDFAEKIQRA